MLAPLCLILLIFNIPPLFLGYGFLYIFMHNIKVRFMLWNT